MKTETHVSRHSVSWPWWAGLAIVMLANASRAQFYAVTDLGTLGGTNGMAYGINNHEQIVGAAQTGAGAYHAFMFDQGQMIDVGTMGGSNSWAYGINDSGWMVGASEVVDGETNVNAFLCTNAWEGDDMMDLATLGGSNSVAWNINMDGEMVGWSEMAGGSTNAFIITNGIFGDMMGLGAAGGTDSEADCINSNGVIVGATMMFDGSEEPIMGEGGPSGEWNMTVMGMGGMGGWGQSGGQSWSVNNLGAAAGQAAGSGGTYHAFVSGPGGMMGGRVNVNLGTLGGGNSVAYCIDDAGTAVGSSELPDGAFHAFMVTNALAGMAYMMDLNGLIPTNSGWELIAARGINAAGQIVGWGMYGGHTNGFLLTPVSTPITGVSGPSTQIGGPGDALGMGMQISGGGPLSYEWLHDGMPIAGATNATFTLPGMSMEDAGQYTVTARNAVGTVASASAVAAMFGMSYTNGMALMSIAAPTGTRFRIDYSNSLGNGASWQTLSSFTMMGQINQITDTPLQGPGARFYRAVITR
jgi:probable HAF family extracellular repeat protein